MVVNKSGYASCLVYFFIKARSFSVASPVIWSSLPPGYLMRNESPVCDSGGGVSASCTAGPIVSE